MGIHTRLTSSRSHVISGMAESVANPPHVNKSLDNHVYRVYLVDMAERFLTELTSVRFDAATWAHVKRIAATEERKPGWVLRRLVAKALKSEKVK